MIDYQTQYNNYRGRRLTAFLSLPPSSAFPASTRWVGGPGRRDGIVASQKPTSNTIGFLIFSALTRSSIPLVLKTKERTRMFLDHDTLSILYFRVSIELLRIRYSSLRKENLQFQKLERGFKQYLPAMFKRASVKVISRFIISSICLTSITTVFRPSGFEARYLLP